MEINNKVKIKTYLLDKKGFLLKELNLTIFYNSVILLLLSSL